MTGENILIVDDNPANLRLESFILMRAGFHVRTAQDAQSAMDSILSSPPQLVLMDVQLPGMDGLELTRRLKADPRTREIIVVAATAYAMKEDEAKAKAAGCDGYISKPIDVKALSQIVARHLRSAQGGSLGP
jgi:two-component system cell cycle response regulator DivK